MKGTSIIGVALLSPALVVQAEIVAQWNFNSRPPDGSTSTGALSPSVGLGTAIPIGGITSSFSSGSAADPEPDNTAWHTTSYPGAATNNRTAGVQFSVDTSGYTNVWLSWAQRHSDTASRYCRLLYTVDGYTWLEGRVIEMTTGGVWSNVVADLGAVAGAANNPAFGFQIVTEFESTATGAGANRYLPTAAGSSYSSSGTIRFDLVTVNGIRLPGANTAPGISAIPDQVLRVGQSSGPIEFTVWDFEEAGSALVLSESSSDPAVVPDWNIVFAGDTGHRTVTLTAGEQPGTSTITVYVYDSGGKWSSTSFRVTVLPWNTSPWIGGLAGTNTLINSPAGPVPFTVGDLETPAGNLVVTGCAWNAELLPPSGLTFDGSGADRTVTLAPAAGRAGNTPVTIEVSDGTNRASAVFALMVRPDPAVVFYEPFDYADGSLLTNSGFLWAHRSGSNGQCAVLAGELQLSGAQTEDVLGLLAGGPYQRSNRTVLYASFKLRVETLPKPRPEYFAHFADGTSTLRGRVFAGTTNAAPGCYRLSVANGSETVVELAQDLQTNVTYRVVSRYDIDAATTRLWVDPALETDPGVEATDSQPPVKISSYAFRQDSGLGAVLWVDDLRVGLTFAAVVPDAPPERPRLWITPEPGRVILRWEDPAFHLESAADLDATFTPVQGAVSPFTNLLTAERRFFRLKR